jgi:protein-S-isoprenylcysteine O-methyltransferase Ste14
MHGRLLARLYVDAWIFAGLVWLIAALFTKRTERTEPLSSRLVQFGWTLLSVILLSFGRLPWGPLGVRVIPRSFVLGNAGLALTIAGIAFALWARFYLGRNWSGRVTLKENHELIRTGPYAIVRHPIYSGFLLALTGTVIAIGEIRAILALVIVAIGLHFKSKTEERFMSEKFSEQYATYSREVKSLIPYIL